MVTPVQHTLVCGASRSGKSAAELARLLPLAQAGTCALVLLDPAGELAQALLLHLDFLGLTQRVLYDRLADTDRVPGYAWLVPSQHPDPLQRQAENDERIREFTSILLRRRGILDLAGNPVIEEALLAALRLYMQQPTPVPLPWLADVFVIGSAARTHLLGNCTEPELVRKFQEYAALGPTGRRREVAPAERILQAVCRSPTFAVRSWGATFDFDRFLDDRGILILDGSSQGNLARDAAGVMLGAVILRVIQHCRTGARSPVVLVLDEAVNAGLIGLYESQALAEAGKWGLEFHILVQDPFGFPTPEIRSNVLQNTAWRHEWFRQGSPEAARLAAEDLAIPLLDPLRVHHTEYRTRTVDAGFERIPMTSHSEWHDPHQHHRTWSTGWSSVLWPRRREVREAQDRYTALQDQILLMQKELMRLQPGYRFVRSSQVSPVPEYVPLRPTPWAGFDVPAGPARALAEDGLSAGKLREALQTMKEKPLFQPAAAPARPEDHRRRQPSAARLLARP